jgi:hypothetical protein
MTFVIENLCELIDVLGEMVDWMLCILLVFEI